MLPLHARWNARTRASCMDAFKRKEMWMWKDGKDERFMFSIPVGGGRGGVGSECFENKAG